MSNAIRWPEGIEKAKSLFDEHVLRKARFLVDHARVSDTKLAVESGTVTSTVLGGAPYVSSIFKGPDGAWSSSCTCARKMQCKHCAAVLITILDDQAIAAKAEVSAKKSARATAIKVDSFLGYVISVLKRPLSDAEKRFCKQVDHLYTFNAGSSRIDQWSLMQLGWRFEADIYGNYEYAPAPARNVVEFWNYLHYAAQLHRLPIPEFLQGLPPLDEGFESQIIEWRRKKELRHWLRRLENVSEELREGGVSSDSKQAEVVELRLRFAEEFAALEVRKADAQNFARVKLRFLRDLNQSIEAGSMVVEDSCRPLVDAYMASFRFEERVTLDYEVPDVQGFLSKLFRIRPFPEYLVGPSGEPLTWIDEPLRWVARAPHSDCRDYVLCLQQPDGSPPPSPIAIIGRGRSYFLTQETVRPCPPVPKGVLHANLPNPIPAEVVETAAGIRFLNSVRCELPERLESKLQRVVPKISIGCKLKPLNSYSTTEHCEFNVKANAQSQFANFSGDWDGRDWKLGEVQGAPKINNDFLLSVVDQTMMDRIPKLMECFNLKPASYQMDRPKCRVTKSFPETFVQWYKSIPPGIKVTLDKTLQALVEGEVSATVQLHVEEDGVDWFNLRVTVDTKATDLSPQELKALLDARGAYVRLANKGWRKMSFALTEEEDKRLAQLGVSPHELSSEPQRLHALQLAHEAARRFLPPAQSEKIERRAKEIRARVTPAQPGEVHAELRPYQTDGFHFLAYLSSNRFGGILADDMGLGKTLQALTWLAWIRSELKDTGPTLVVCPKSVTDNWKSEATKFTPGLRVRVWTAADVGTLAEESASADLHIVNYVQLRLAAETAARIEWNAVILDEGQNIKNPDSQTAQAARALKAGHRLVLSGTPIENRLLDLWSLMAFAMPGALGNRAQFLRTYDAKGDPLARQRLTARVRPFLLRRTKGQVAKDLPDRIEEDLFCEMEGEQKRLYQAELKLAQQRLLGVETQEQLAKERFHFLTSLLRLRQICCHTALIKGDSKDESAKVNALVEMLEPLMEEGHKVLIFSQFVGVLEILEDTFKAQDYRCFKLTGETENRGDMVEQFQGTQGAAIFLISLKAGGFGLNLTAASYVVLFDPWWNPAVENQAIDRTHRIGQTSKVIAYRLLIKNSIEEKIRLLQKQKSSLASDLLGEEKFAQSLTMDDLQFLLA